jgi:outer membrane protein assembly factor BamB
MSLAQRILRILVALLIALTVGVSAAPVDRAAMIGFRGNGSGVFPADCVTPTEFDGPSGKGIAWQCPLPNWGNASPIVVGKKAFVLCEAGNAKPEDDKYLDVPLLVCIDADTGKELWRRGIDCFDSVPDQAEADKLRKLRREYYETAHKQHLAGEKCIYADWQDKGKLSKQFAPYGYFDNAMWGRLGMGNCMPTPVSDGKRVFVFTGHRTMTAFDLDGNRLWQQFHHTTMVPCGANTEYCGQSPVVVGDRVLMHFLIEGKGEKLGLRCYDTSTGKLLWTTPTEQLPHNAMGSPQVLHLPAEDEKREPAVFCYSGELIRVRDGKVLCSKIGYVKRCAGLGTDGVDRVFLANGWHGAGKRGPDAPWVPGRFGISDALAPLHQDQRLNIGVRFTLKDDVAEPKLLWAFRGGPDDPQQLRTWTGRRNLDPYPVYRNGRLYLVDGQVWDAETGAVINTAINTGRAPLGEQGIALAGGCVLGTSGYQSKDCRISLTPVTDAGYGRTAWLMLEKRDGNPAWQTDEWKAKVKAETGGTALSLWGGWHPSFALPFASGNRLFIRTFDYLWCIGDKDTPFTPSAAFAERN